MPAAPTCPGLVASKQFDERLPNAISEDADRQHTDAVGQQEFSEFPDQI